MTDLKFDIAKEGSPVVVGDGEFWTKLAREVKLEKLGVHTFSANRFDLVKATRKNLRALWDGLVVDENGLSSFSTGDFLPNSNIYEHLDFKWSTEEEKEEQWLLFEIALDKPSAEWPEALKKKLKKKKL